MSDGGLETLAGARSSTSGGQRVVLVPGALALLPEYAGQQDPLAELRAACRAAVAWLCEPGDTVAVHCEHQSLRLARHLVGEAGGTLHPRDDRAAPTLVIGNGSARRTEKAPGHLDPRAESFDAALGRALTSPDPAALAALDGTLAEELWADVESLRWLGAEVLTGSEQVMVDYDDDPYGVQYWVLRWEREQGVSG